MLMNSEGCYKVSEMAQSHAGRQHGKSDFRDGSDYPGVGESGNKEDGSGVDGVESMEQGLEGELGRETTDGHAVVVNKLKVALMEQGLDLGAAVPSIVTEVKEDGVANSGTQQSHQ
ncbi:hypothetical protein COCNU_14G010070 [Cocos nucifera]|uniref:Uncharacterized protein n=1 Tax=Cocos nucifera TaxID=13894 RepID=A0A8K0IX81_COCNU|nr:hypothetical protein COCNU_14G010070 [Cocos nucifera]